MTEISSVTFALVLAVGVTVAQQGNDATPFFPAAEEQAYGHIISLKHAGQFQLALQESENFLLQFPQSSKQAEVFFLAAECQFVLGRTLQAQQRYRDFLARFPTSSLLDQTLFRLGEISYADGEYSTAAATFKELLDRFGDSPLAGEAAYWVGESRLKLNEPVEALKYFELCYQFYPTNRHASSAMYSAGWIRRDMGDMERALEAFQRLEKEFPSSPLLSSTRVRIGECFFRLKDYHAAIASLSRSRSTLTDEEDRAECSYLLGESYYRVQDYLQTVLTLDEFLQRYAGHRLEREARYTLAWTFFQERNYEKAADLFAALANGTDETAHSALYQKGVAQKLGGKLGDALSTFMQCSEQSGIFADNALYEIGLLQYSERDYDEARETFTKLVEEYPSSDVRAAAYRMMGEANLALGLPAEALEAFHNARSVPGAPIDVVTDAEFQEAWTLMKLNRHQEAAAAFGRFAVERAKDPRVEEAYFWKAESYYRAEEYRMAAEAYGAFLDLYPTSKRARQAYYGLGWCRVKAEEYAAAATAFEKVVQLKEQDPAIMQDVNIQLGECYVALNDFAAAARAYRAVIRQCDDRTVLEYAHYRLAQCGTHIETPSEALAQYLDYLSAFPHSSFADDAMFDIGMILFREKDYRSAIRQFKSLLTHFPQSEYVPVTHARIGDAWRFLKNYKRAEESYTTVLEKYATAPAVVDAVRGLQHARAQSGRVEEASRTVDAFLSLHPEHPLAERLALAKAEFFFERKEFEKAANEYTSFMERYPRSDFVPDALNGLGWSYRFLTRLDEAGAAFRLLAEQYPNTPLAPEALLELGRIHVDRAEYSEATAALERVEMSYPGTVSALEASYEKGVVYLETNAAERAEQQFRALLGQNPDASLAAQALMGLGRAKQQQQAYSEAESLFTRIATQGKGDIAAEAQLRIGETLFLQQRYDEALTALQRVKTAFPTAREAIARAYLKIGECYERLSNTVKARQAYQSVIRLHKRDEFGREAERKMKGLEDA
jgi:TolA-binding protein